MVYFSCICCHTHTHTYTHTHAHTRAHTHIHKSLHPHTSTHCRNKGPDQFAKAAHTCIHKSLHPHTSTHCRNKGPDQFAKAALRQTCKETGDPQSGISSRLDDELVRHAKVMSRLQKDAALWVATAVQGHEARKQQARGMVCQCASAMLSSLCG